MNTKLTDVRNSKQKILRMFLSDHTFPQNQFISPDYPLITHILTPSLCDCREIRADGYCLLGRRMCPKEPTWSLHKSFTLCGLDSDCQGKSWGIVSVTMYIFWPVSVHVKLSHHWSHDLIVNISCYCSPTWKKCAITFLKLSHPLRPKSTINYYNVTVMNVHECLKFLVSPDFLGCWCLVRAQIYFFVLVQWHSTFLLSYPPPPRRCKFLFNFIPSYFWCIIHVIHTLQSTYKIN
jgi:hypothetical protein